MSATLRRFTAISILGAWAILGSVAAAAERSQEATGDWAQLGRDAQHTGWNSDETTLSWSNVSSLQTRWKIDGDHTYPVSAGGLVYVGMGTSVVALDASTGAQTWAFTPPLDESSVGMPAVADGRLYVIATSPTGPFEKCKVRVIAVDAASGDPHWSAPTGCAGGVPPMVADGTVLVHSGFDLNAFDAITGQRRWVFPTEANINTVPAVSAGTAFFPSADGNFYAVQMGTGQRVWSIPVETADSPPAVVGDQVFLGLPDGHLWALSASDGQLRWSYDTGPIVESGPAVAYGTVYVGSQDGWVYAVASNTGQERWKFFSGLSNVGVYASPAIANGVVFVGSDKGDMFALNAWTGRRLWRFTAESFGSAAVSNGQVFVQNFDQFGANSALYAFGLPGDP